MIKAIIFDLDGTLVQTEIVKAHSYAKAIALLSANAVTENEVIQNFKNYVGLSRNDVAKNLVRDYHQQLKSLAKSNEDIEDMLIENRLEIYNSMLEDPSVLPKYCCTMTMGFLNTVHEYNYLTGLATMSHCMQVERVLQIMNIKDKFKFVITRDEIENAKPHPEIYLRMKNKLQVESDECVVIEDSVAGIKAALSANMHVFAVTNSITKDSVHTSKLLDKKFIIDNPAELETQVYEFIESLK
ncbi:Putative phosphatase/phosphohexomutase [Ignavibacterium album JCM 16511]|uniref:Putative phosphatase/phosphohexomutase n=1 Tax=Ignavibacterium album (strain DSM 19864 / JCM 16511 / NBRC 101810 / Mat9-16) TaxID=945713 RepID=I0AL11_IGNAJ|nr:HAD family phosphatase [Ignavibacterium album]AFH49668.1 Putative phosphatase/phosphohexomutase [Ignavibacterium album JCM 16511]